MARRYGSGTPEDPFIIHLMGTDKPLYHVWREPGTVGPYAIAEADRKDRHILLTPRGALFLSDLLRGMVTENPVRLARAIADQSHVDG